LKRLIPFIIAALLLNSCLKEDAWCPTISVGFAMVDEYLEGDYDSRIKNDVLLYIFNEDKLVYAKNISYKEIEGGNRYSIAKTPELLGNLKFVAWAVKDGEKHIGTNDDLTVHLPRRHAEYNIGSGWADHHLTHELHEGETDLHMPHHHERYLGTAAPLRETLWDTKESEVDIVMTPAPGRLVVNIADPNGYLGDNAHVIIEGGMSHMALGDPKEGRTGRLGSGTRANVRTAVNEIPASTRAAGDETTHSTEIFGVLPTENNAELKVHIMNGDENIKTLKISAENTKDHFKALRSGDYLEFYYNIVSADVVININGFEIREINGEL
jgi:hypothetical protein